jgi:hypothetical protein
VKLNDVDASALGGGDRLDFHDLDRVSAGSVLGTHVSVALSDGTLGGQISVLSVHVVCARARVVSQPDGEVLDGQRSSLVDLEEDFDKLFLVNRARFLFHRC